MPFVVPETAHAAILSEVKRLDAALVAFRRDVHAHPEIANTEHRTTERICTTLAEVGLESTVLPVGTGALVDIAASDGVEPTGGRMGFRADIDALPILEQSGAAFASVTTGLSHACGHDVHTTVVVGLGLLLVALRDQGLLTRDVRLIFQPAEESSPGGAVDAIDGGALKDLAEVYALHCDPRVDAGQLGLRVGPITSAVDRVHVTLHGPGGHTSRPHLTADLVGALGAVATTTPLLLSRRVDPRYGVSLVWGRMVAGTAGNAIPSSGDIEGTLRALTVPGWQQAEALLPDIIRQIVAPYGVRVDVSVTEGVPPTVNHPGGVARFEASAEALVGPTAVVSTEQSMGGEDFAWMLQQVPGALARLGVRRPGQTTAPDIHTPHFTVDERAIGIGLRLLAGVALLQADPEAETPYGAGVLGR
ncbi:MAG: amidohydrolase [Propionibacteriaceae bacterium]